MIGKFADNISEYKKNEFNERLKAIFPTTTRNKFVYDAGSHMHDDLKNPAYEFAKHFAESLADHSISLAMPNLSGATASDLSHGKTRLKGIFTAYGQNIKNLRVLDIGCGSNCPENYAGKLLVYAPTISSALSALGAKVTGLDYRKNPTANYNHIVCNFVEEDMNSIFAKIGAEKFDLIVASNLSGGIVKTAWGEEYNFNEIHAKLEEMIAFASDENTAIYTDLVSRFKGLSGLPNLASEYFDVKAEYSMSDCLLVKF